MSRYQPTCKLCGEDYEYGRWKKGYAVCLDCGDEIAKERKFTVACNNKQGYELITDISLLKQLNPKRTT